MTDSDTTRKWTVLGEIKLGNYLKIPLIGSLMPAGASIGLDSLMVGYNSKKLEQVDLPKLRDLLKDIHLPSESDKRWMEAGPFMVANVMLGPTQQPLIFTPSPPKSTVLEGSRFLPVGVSDSVSGGGAGAPVNETVAWWNLDKTIGPAHVGRLGAGFEPSSKSVLLLADLDVGAGGFRFGTRGLGVGIPINKPEDTKLHLDGVSLEYNRPPITIAGEFIRENPGPGYTLAVGGMAVVGTPAVSVSALGFYAQPITGDPSLFVFGMLDLSKQSVGSAVFRLEKVAAGFGYNSQVRTPTLAEVPTFPFVEMLNQKYAQRNPLDELTNLVDKKWVTPASNEMWLAVGLEALIYELVDVNAVAIVQFGDDIVAGLYGQASAQFPKYPANPIAALEVDVRAEYRGSTDTLEIDAVVANGSFVLDRACRLTGGLAVRLWLGRSAHPGEFVISVGGYNPKFDVPKYYPRPERVGFDWHLGDRIHVWGNCYAALTPRAFMAGMKAGLSGQFGIASVDAEVYADALIEWDPLYFNVDWGGTIRASAGPFSIEFGADGEVWGPPVGGHVRVHIGPWNINVDFGQGDPKGRTRLDADEFRAKLLPGGTIKPAIAGAEKTTGNTSTENGKVVTVNATQGLLPAPRGKDAASPVWAFGVGSLAIQVSTAVPLSSIKFNDTPVPTTSANPRPKLCIRPMEANNADSSLTITLKGPDGTKIPVTNNPPGGSEKTKWSVITDKKGVPAALWAEKGEKDRDGLIDGYASGFTLMPPSPDQSRDGIIPASATKRELFSFLVQSESAVQNYTSDSNGRRLPAMSTPDIERVSGNAARDARQAIIDDLKKLEMPGFSAKDLVADIFKAGASGYLDAEPQILKG
ncbi:DUF6603 domain-containing protein [Streptomyces sp. NPDC002537]